MKFEAQRLQVTAKLRITDRSSGGPGKGVEKTEGRRRVDYARSPDHWLETRRPRASLRAPEPSLPLRWSRKCKRLSGGGGVGGTGGRRRRGQAAYRAIRAAQRHHQLRLVLVWLLRQPKSLLHRKSLLFRRHGAAMTNAHNQPASLPGAVTARALKPLSREGEAPRDFRERRNPEAERHPTLRPVPHPPSELPLLGTHAPRGWPAVKIRCGRGQKCCRRQGAELTLTFNFLRGAGGTAVVYSGDEKTEKTCRDENAVSSPAA